MDQAETLRQFLKEIEELLERNINEDGEMPIQLSQGKD